MRVDEFDFELPEERIAVRPLDDRLSARMLEVEGVERHDRTIRDLPSLVRPGDALVFNDTKVIPAQLNGTRARLDKLTGETVKARISVTLHMMDGTDGWHCFVRPAKKVSSGEQIDFDAGLSAKVEQKSDGGEVLLRFNKSGDALMAAIGDVGEMPLPPYIASKRAQDAQDQTDYQTSYAKHEGAVAAPTAGLHFTAELLDQLRVAGASLHFLTLHVGAGTFLPVKAEDTVDHKMHAEIGQLSEATASALNQARQNGGRIIAIGTTSLRLLESATSNDGIVQPFTGATDIFITPGYRFRAVDGLLTNFHLPRSTLFMLVSAFAGLREMRRAYDHAIAANYRFYSYGDACFLHRKPLEDADGNL
ncbi:MAG: tRNA preQ1(34) S-adenosylmethionine ribosyltransferase-isomerase QueA [Pseudomonadota bacterium]